MTFRQLLGWPLWVIIIGSVVYSTPPEFEHIGFLHAPMEYASMLLTINKDDIITQHENYKKEIITAMARYDTAVWKLSGYKPELRYQYQHFESLAENVMEMLGWKKHPSLKQSLNSNPNSTEYKTREKRQVGVMLAVTALALGSYNAIQIEELSNKVDEDHKIALDMSHIADRLNATLTHVLQELQTGQLAVQLRDAIRHGIAYWNNLESLYLAALQGNIIPVLQSRWFRKKIQTALVVMSRKAENTKCTIQPSIESLMLIGTTGVRTKNDLKIIVHVPCIQHSTPLYRWDHTQKVRVFNEQNKSVINDIRTQERFMAIHETEMEKRYIFLQAEDLIQCVRTKTSGDWFCPHIRRSTNDPNLECIGALWKRNTTAIVKRCNLTPSKYHQAFIQVRENEYVFTPPGKCNIICTNGTKRSFQILHKWKLEEGCSLEIGDTWNIVRIRHSEMTVKGVYHEDPTPLDNVNFAIDIKNLETPLIRAEHSIRSLITWNHFFTLTSFIIIIGELAFTSWRILLMRSRNKKRLMKKMMKRNKASMQVEMDTLKEDIDSLKEDLEV